MQTVKIDFANPGIIKPVRAMQGDVFSRFVAIELYDQGMPYTPPEGASYQVGYMLRGGFEGAYNTVTIAGGSTRPACVADGNTVTIELAEALTVDGNTGTITLVITADGGFKLHTWAIPFIVGQASGASITDPSINNLGELVTAALAQVQTARDSAQASAENAQASADRAAASEPAGAAERAETAAFQAQTSQNAAESAKTAAQASQSAAAQSAEKSEQQAQLANNAAQSASESAEAAKQYAHSIDPNVILPVGTVYYFATSSPPENFLLCDGSAVSRTTYANLFAAIGTRFGEGDGTTTFNLPDLRGVDGVSVLSTTITLGGAAPGSVVKIGRNGEPVDFYVFQHGLERTILVQDLLDDTPRSMEDGGNGYINGAVDIYLNGVYISGFDDPSIIAALPNEIQYEWKEKAGDFDGSVITKSAVRSAYLLTYTEYASGVFPAIAKDSTETAREYWTQSIYTKSYSIEYDTVNASGTSGSAYADESCYIRPAISLPNSAIVEDDGTVIIPSQDRLKILPCIKF